MSLSEGQKLGPYEIIEPAGAGGMGEIFKARDTRLDRTVAIKVLPENTALNADLKARFEREAKAISSLNHPNICTLYDIGTEDGVDYLVMEFLEGETLADRLKKGPLDLVEVYDIAIEVADALDKAHRQGLIHRDLKPGNIMLTEQGAKLLDFGLAKLKITEGQGQSGPQVTQTTPLTGVGTILGTLQYMAPEQLEGAEADARSDIFAFGIVMYEMLTGLKAFDGKSQAALIASVIGQEPTPVSEVKPMTPPGLSRLVKKCIEKEPENRWQSARDLADELRWISRSGSQAGIPAPVSSHRRFRMRAGWTVAVVAIAIAIGLGTKELFRTEPEPKVTRFELQSRQGLTNMRWPRLSPDGRMIAFRALDSTGQNHVYIRPLNSLEAYPLQGTERAGRPFWSPDSKYLAYFVGDQLMKIPVSGGPAQLICETNGADGAWGSSGTILFDGSDNDSIRQVSASGGIATAATTIDREIGEKSHAWPCFLPDGDHFLYTARPDSATDNAWGDLTLKVGSLSGGVDKALTNVETRIEYSGTGHVLFVRKGTLLAQQFDSDKLELIGEPIPIAQDVLTRGGSRAYFSVSDDGALVYMVGTATGNSQLVWVDREGREIETVGDPGNYFAPKLSPDESRLAYGDRDDKSGQTSVWIRDLRRNVSSKLTFDPSDNYAPFWSPDGSTIYYANGSGSAAHIMAIRANGLGQPRGVFDPTDAAAWPSCITGDGKTLYWTYLKESPNADIWRMNPDDSSSAEPLIATPHTERNPSVSPDGRYLAYVSNETGGPEIYILSLTGDQGKWQVSTGGGLSPLWSKDGQEIFFSTLTQDIMAVSVNTEGTSPEIGIPKKLFNRRWGFDVSNDGSRFIFASPIRDQDDSRFFVVLNWNRELESP